VIRKLQIKFICVIMTIVMLMLGIILGVVIYFTAQSMEAQSINMMRAVVATPFQPNRPDKAPDQVRLPFFTVQLSKTGNVNGTNGGFFDLSDKDYVQKIADMAFSSPTEVGTLEDYNLRFLKSEDPKGYTIVFTDLATETATLRNMFLNCLVIFFVSAVPFWGISIILSRWVIRPVENTWDQQRQFVADASHELKTPLSVIMANAELLQSEDTEESEARKFAKNILSVSYQMRSLVENMLEMARVDNGVLQVKYDSVDLSQLVNDAVLSFQLLYEEKELSLHRDIQADIHIHGCEQQLYQMLDVLLDNALKYSAPNGMVRVQLKHVGRNCVLNVSNPGAPISKEDLKNIFKRFYRVDKARSMDGSYGLGLSIAEAVVNSHKGKIWAESKDGSNTFYVQLPVSCK